MKHKQAEILKMKPSVASIQEFQDQDKLAKGLPAKEAHTIHALSIQDQDPKEWSLRLTTSGVSGLSLMALSHHKMVLRCDHEVMTEYEGWGGISPHNNLVFSNTSSCRSRRIA